MISIYNYSNSVSYLSDFFNYKKSADENFSLSTWSKEAGLTGPSIIIDILKGKKKLKTNMAASFVDKIGLDASEFVFFLALTSKSESQNPQIEKMYDLLLLDLRPSQDSQFNSARFSDGDMFSHWILTTILGAIKLKDIELTSKNLKQILREEISEEIIELGIQYLVETGLIKNENGKFIRTYSQVSTVTDKKHHNVNHYFTQMADLSKKAVDLPLDAREFQSFNMPISKEQLPMAKEIIRKCRSSLSAICTDNADEVYQMNMFLFPLTDRSASRKEISN